MRINYPEARWYRCNAGDQPLIHARIDPAPLPMWMPAIGIRRRFGHRSSIEFYPAVPTGWRHVCNAYSRNSWVCVPWWLYHYARLELYLADRIWEANDWLIRKGVLQLKEEGGYLSDIRIAHPRHWLRGDAPYWGKR